MVIDGADLLHKENSKVDQTIVLATSEETLPLNVPNGVRFLSLAEGRKPNQAPVSTGARPPQLSSEKSMGLELHA